MSALQNQQAEVLGFDNGSVYQSIMSFLNDSRLSENTRKSYEKSIRDFFKFVSKVDISLLTESHLIAIKNEHVKNYRTSLKKSGIANTSINQKLRAVSSLFQEIAKDRDGLNPAKVQLKPLPEPKNNYGEFSKEEVDMMIEHAKTMADGIQKSLLLELAIKTSFRKNYLLSLRWCDIKKVNDNLYEIEGRDESSKMENEKTIKKEFYDRLLQLKRTNDSTDTVFHMHPKTASLLIQQLVEALNLDPNKERKLAFHSLKNYGIMDVLKRTKSLELTQQQSNHKSGKTLLEKYVRFSKDPSKNPSLLVNEATDTSVIQQATLEQLLKAIDQSDEFVKIALVQKLNEIMG